MVAKDLEKRKRVMQRSMRLGHCICNPKQPCPCDTFREHDVCPCAGERFEVAPGPVRLTDLVESAGCASKIDEVSLHRVLSGLPSLDDPRVLVGMPAGDDAGVYRLDDGSALVQTVDVFSPSVDDPFTFGQVAAANSLSDVYAMGGRPITALSIVGFPIRTVSDEVLHQILQGGIQKMTEAGVPVIGGHSIHDQEIKAGFAVTGLVAPERLVTHDRARPGDRLVLTKPIGTGILAFAAQIGRAPDGGIEAAARSMTQLNRLAAERMIEFGAHACTDVTGFGLMGHLASMAAASGVDVELLFDDLPLLPGVLTSAAEGILSGGVERNRESSAARVDADANVEPVMLDICFDPQTSGGLLIAVSESKADALVARLREDGAEEAAVIGRVVGQGSGRVRVRYAGRRVVPKATCVPRGQASPTVTIQEANPMSCCQGGEGAGSTGAGSTGAGSTGAGEPAAGECCAAGSAENAGGVPDMFLHFLKAAGAPGALDARTKRAVAIALSVLAKCEPCVKIHVKKAREEGFSQEQIDEAAWLAIGFGGSPTMMFYNRLKMA